MSKLDKDALANAAQAMCDHGIEIRSPDDGDLDDLEAERYDALRAAILAYLTTPGLSSPAAEPVAIAHVCEECGVEIEQLRPIDSGTRLYAAPVELDALHGEIERLRLMLRQLGACMSCIDGPADPHGCTDCLNTGWEGGAPAGYVAESTLARVTAERDEAVRLLGEIGPALNDMFCAGIEEREGGSAKRQERLMRRGEELRKASLAFLSRLSRKDTDNE